MSERISKQRKIPFEKHNRCSFHLFNLKTSDGRRINLSLFMLQRLFKSDSEYRIHL